MKFLYRVYSIHFFQTFEEVLGPIQTIYYRDNESLP
jgi:hypothetical protein